MGRPRLTDQPTLQRKTQDSPTARFLAMYLTYFPDFRDRNICYRPEDRRLIEDIVLGHLRVDQAVQFGLIKGYLVVWGRIRSYPATIKQIRLYLHGGPDEWRERLSEPIVAELREWAVELAGAPKHSLPERKPHA